ncbi:hypothetical protein COT94_04350 [Candidatus Falkowbacteria bacterium CG10_big_fil_rev_8_21_14_0_10_37_14]|uniref:Uncharacterized protein n=1 Tax=Candidatus Falkowbacteria bacterium CG10_big_fil_rev_8_21_14_0_10_37_14 TaxID=1974561 RepID=A0A2M6WSM0_9BACT|nr:hypothetical protein [Candidatus Falkowbacteria bacterium]PIT95788.1 MAG: hypothetical protein COT94_04350 [Candidatus Falkowbacteria bacterium CG10_big_fil_rev_8_21_14_0_10_37_14]
MSKSFIYYAGRLVFDWLGSLLYFPLWWYGKGLWSAIRGLVKFLADEWQWLNPGVWFKNLLVPMYGQRDWVSRLISFFVRLVQTILRFLAWLCWLAVCLVAVVIWLVLPIFLASQIFYQLS